MDARRSTRNRHEPGAAGPDVGSGGAQDELPGYCARCGASLAADHECDRAERAAAALDPPRFCTRCGARATIQVLPSGYGARCLRCERRGRRAMA